MACLRMVYQDAVIVWCLGLSASVPQHTAALHAMQYVQTELHVTSAACELDMNATCVVIVDLVVFALCLHMTHVTACQADLHVASRMRQGKTVCSSTRWLSAACQAAALLYLLAAPPSIPTDMSLQGGVMRASTAVQQARTRVITTVYLTSEEDMR